MGMRIAIAGIVMGQAAALFYLLFGDMLIKEMVLLGVIICVGAQALISAYFYGKVVSNIDVVLYQITKGSGNG